MGCGGSKVDDLPLVTLCRERKELIKAASDHRYALAAAHVSYFQSLRDVGDAIRRFVDEELVIGSGSGSFPGSPVLTLPSQEGKTKKKPPKDSSSSPSISHSFDDHKHDDDHDDGEGSHLHLSSGSDSDSDSSPGHIHIEESPEEHEVPSSSSYPYPYPYGYPQANWGSPGGNPYMYYMRKSAAPSQSFVYEEPERHQTVSGQWPDSTYGYSGYQQYPSGGYFGYPMGSPQGGFRQPSPPAPPPAPPSPPRVSTWDYLNVFDNFDNGVYPGYYPQSRYGYGSSNSSPDSKEVREREGIPDLEDETEPEVLKEVYKEKHKMVDKEIDANKQSNKNSGEGTSRAVPVQNHMDGPSSSRAVPLHKNESTDFSSKEGNSSSSIDTIASKSSVEEEEYARKKGVSFEVEEASTVEIESSKQSSLTTLSARGTRDIQEVVKEIKDEFETASGHGKEVALLLEVGSLPYQHRGSPFKVIFSRILYHVAPSMFHPLPPPPRFTVKVSSRTMKLAKAYSGESGKGFNTQPGNLSSTLEKLYAWEKKLYKEVKDEERLRVIYEKQCEKLRILDDRGAESSKIDATQTSIRKLLTKINVSIRSIDAISSRIHKLRDEELQPLVNELIHGWTRMWRSMLKCHQKQFQAIMESKVRSFKANTVYQKDSGLKATIELEMELLNWCTRFNDWITTQKLYIESLNGWLLKCLPQEPIVTPDGIAPFSPSRIGAPPIFVICNDWHQAMIGISEEGVANAMHSFASSLHQLWERQDLEQRQRIKAEYLSKDFEKRLRTLRMEREKMEHEHDAASEKTAVSKITSGSGISPLDDLKVDLDSMRKRLEEERARHKEAIKLVHDAASSSLQAGLIPIFESLDNFSSEILKAHEQVRV